MKRKREKTVLQKIGIGFLIILAVFTLGYLHFIYKL